MNQNTQGKAGITILIIVIVLIIAGTLFFVNRSDEPIILEDGTPQPIPNEPISAPNPELDNGNQIPPEGETE